MTTNGKAPAKRRGAPRTMPTQDIIDEVCDLVAKGSNLTRIGKDKNNGLPSETAYYRWLSLADRIESGTVRGTDRIDGIGKSAVECQEEKQYRRGVIDFRKCYARAREQRADSRADRIDAIAKKVETGDFRPDQGRVLIDVEKWQAGKEKPQVYGDRTQMELTGKDGGPVETSNQSLAMAIVGVLQDGGGDVETLLGVADTPSAELIEKDKQ